MIGCGPHCVCRIPAVRCPVTGSGPVPRSAPRGCRPGGRHARQRLATLLRCRITVLSLLRGFDGPIRYGPEESAAWQPLPPEPASRLDPAVPRCAPRPADDGPRRSGTSGPPPVVAAGATRASPARDRAGAARGPRRRRWAAARRAVRQSGRVRPWSSPGDTPRTDQPSIAFLSPTAISILRGLAFSATGIVSLSTPASYVASMLSVSRFSPRNSCRLNTPRGRSAATIS